MAIEEIPIDTGLAPELEEVEAQEAEGDEVEGCVPGGCGGGGGERRAEPKDGRAKRPAHCEDYLSIFATVGGLL